MCLFSIKKLYFLNNGPMSLQLSAMDIIGISGASGSGKSKLLRALADLDEHEGEVKLKTVEQQKMTAHKWREKVALLSAETHWWFDTVEEHFTDLTRTQLHALALPEDCAQWSVARLSSGEKQRLGLLRLLENKPMVLLLDEPTANLDQHNSLLFEQFVIHYLKENQACAIWISHDEEQLQRISKKKFAIEKGEINRVD